MSIYVKDAFSNEYYIYCNLLRNRFCEKSSFAYRSQLLILFQSSFQLKEYFLRSHANKPVPLLLFRGYQILVYDNCGISIVS